MEKQSLLNFTDQLLDTTCLFCAVCKDILNPPIMLVEGEGNICKICYEEKNEEMDWDGRSNSALENVLRLLNLPCKYKPKGCSLRYSYNFLNSHQLNCKYRTVVCPMLNIDCDWEGSTDGFIDHFKQCHGDEVINSENNLFVLEASLNDSNLVKLLISKQHMFILKMQTDIQKNKLYYIICSIDDDDSSFCEYSVKHKGEGENYIKTKSKTISFYHIFNEFNENVAVKIDLDAVKQISHISDTIPCTFKMKFEKKLEKSSAETMDDKLLEFFECTVCKDLMKPPIFICNSGHSICNSCKPKVHNCPTCRSAFTNIRNYSLEHLTELVKYPCVYRDSGCTEIGSANYIVNHESDCSSKHFNCLFSTCKSHGDQDFIIKHLIQCHSDTVIYDGRAIYTLSYDLNSYNVKNKYPKKIIIFCNYIFRITFRNLSGTIYIAAEIVGRRNALRTFIYKVSILEEGRREMKLIKTDYCLNEMPETDVTMKSIVFYYNEMLPYSKNGKVKINISIKEK